MPHRHRIDGCGNVIVARIPRDDRASTLSPEDVDHVRVLAFESLARESTYLARHAEDMWMGENVRCGEDAETTSMHVRKTFSVLDHLGWAG